MPARLPPQGINSTLNRKQLGTFPIMYLIGTSQVKDPPLKLQSKNAGEHWHGVRMHSSL